MTPNCCCCCCHCYMYSVHFCANSCAFNRSLLSVNFCKFTAHTSTMFINKYENKKRKRASPIDSRPIEHVRRISPKNALEKKIFTIYNSPSLRIRTHYTWANWRHRTRDDTIYTCAHPHTHTCRDVHLYLSLSHSHAGNHNHSNYTTRCSKQKTADRRRCHLTYKNNHQAKTKTKENAKKMTVHSALLLCFLLLLQLNLLKCLALERVRERASLLSHICECQVWYLYRNSASGRERKTKREQVHQLCAAACLFLVHCPRE